MKKSLTILLALAVFLTGCAVPSAREETIVPEPDPLVGVWETELDLGEAVQQMLVQPAELTPYFSVKKYPVTIFLRIYEDGTYTVEADTLTASASFEDLLDDLALALEALLKDRIEGVDPTLTVDTVEGWTGLSFAQLRGKAIEQLRQQDPTAYILEQAWAEGNYRTEGDKLYFSLGKENACNPDIWDLYALNSDTLILMSHKGPKVISFWEGYPLVFSCVAE